MPRVVYQCPDCQYVVKKFYKTGKEIQKMLECECGGELVRQLSSPSQRSKMTVDNGVQARATELDRDIVEIIEDREESSLKRRGDSVLENLK